ncbi:MAG: hypothetical protein J5826_05335, partial [Bacteroidales bacterium]|nr:hypothetical protein [Bacteroidales bacterium]
DQTLRCIISFSQGYSYMSYFPVRGRISPPYALCLLSNIFNVRLRCLLQFPSVFDVRRSVFFALQS